MRKNHTIYFYVAIFLCFLFMGSITPITAALNFPAGREDMYIQNNILFYEPGVETKNYNDPYGQTYYSYYGCGEGTGNTNYRGDTIWSDSQLKLVEKNMWAYKSAAESHGLPWEVLAVVHYLEHSLLNNNPKNGQGIFQLYDYTDGGTINIFEPTSEDVSNEEFLRQANLAADELQGKAKGLNLATAGGIKRLFFKYNGTAQRYKDKAISMGFSNEDAENGEGSPYVMNRYDAARDPMYPETMDSRWKGRYVKDHVYDENSVSTRFGAYVRFMALVGLYEGSPTTSPSQTVDTSTNHILTQKAIQLGKHGWKAKDTTPTAAYVDAMKAAGTYNIATVETPGASCDVFVATVIRTTIDKNFPRSSGGSSELQKKYLSEHPEMYQRIYPNGDINVLRDGDILVTGDADHRHIQIYITLNGKPGLASASHNYRTGQYWNTTNNLLTITMHGKDYVYDVYRYIGTAVGGGVNTSGQPCTPQTTTPSAPTSPSAPTEPTTPYPTDNLTITETKAWYTENDFKANSDKIACPQYTIEVQTYNNAHYNSKQIAVNLCEVPSIDYTGRRYTGMEKQNGHAIANSLAAEAFYNFAKDFKTLTDRTVKVTQSFRTYEFQKNVYNCVTAKTLSNEDFKKIYGITETYYCTSSFSGPAKAGQSKHESGLAMDLDISSLFDIEGEDYYGYDPNSCTTGAFTTNGNKTDNGNSRWEKHNRWTLKGMATLCELLPKYGLRLTVHDEPWHLQYVGKYN